MTFLLMLSTPISSSELRMDTREIAPGVHMPVMSIGVGGRESEDAYEIVSNWLTLGGTGIDTALNYGNQDQVHRAIVDSGISREKLFLTTKIPDCNATNVAANFKTDLELLGTSYVDLMLIHDPQNGDCLEAWKILEHHLESHQTRAIGVSNFGPEDLAPIQKCATTLPHVNQIKLNLEVKDLDTIDYCSSLGIVVEAYTPLGKGSVALHPVVQSIAKAHNVTAYQIALKWILQHGWILTFQSSSQEHQASDADVFQFQLSGEEMEQLDHISAIKRTSVL
jgi:diketogulonate reductase-like aldo/keto reductase